MPCGTFGVLASVPVIVVVPAVKPKNEARAIEKLILLLAALTNVEFFVVANAVVLNDKIKNVPVGQCTSTADVAVSVPKTCDIVPKFISLAVIAQDVGVTILTDVFKFNAVVAA